MAENTIDNLSIQVTSNADVVAREFSRLASSARRLRDAAQNAAGGMEKAAEGAQDMGTAAQEAGEQAGEAQTKVQGFGDASEEAGENSKKGASMLSRFWNGLRRIGSGTGSVIGKIGELRNHFGGGLIGAIKQSVSGLGNFFSGIKRIAYYRAIRSAIKLITQGISDGMKNLYYWSQAADKTFAKSMDKITTASKYMGNSFAAMISPLINALAPVIDFIADKIVDLFNLINQVFARLTGQTTYTAALHHGVHISTSTVVLKPSWVSLNCKSSNNLLTSSSS